MADDPKVPVPAEEGEEEEDRAGERVDFAALIDEEEPVVADTGTDADAPDVVATRKVDLDGDSDGWDQADDVEEAEEEEESYTDPETS